MTTPNIPATRQAIEEAREAGDIARAHDLRNKLVRDVLAHIAIENPSNGHELAGEALAAVEVRA